MKKAEKKRGRPRKPKGERRSKNRTFRVRGNLDDYLIAHADEAGRSVSEEIEARLERSFYMDAVMLTFAGDAEPLLNAVATAVGVSFLKLGGLDRYRVMQAAAGYIIAAFGSLNTATTHARAKVSDLRWPPLTGKPEGHELQGLITASWVLNNLSPEVLAEQIEDIGDLAPSGPATEHSASEALMRATADIGDLAPSGPEPRVAPRRTIPDNSTAHSAREALIQRAMAAFDRQSPDLDPRERAAMEARFRAAFNEKPERGHNRRRAID
jgi:hypothetical protein